jgi:hypothetical protein
MITHRSRPALILPGPSSSSSSAGPQGGAQTTVTIFDPLRLPEGIEPSNDPILLVRSEAYAISLSRRLEP